MKPSIFNGKVPLSKAEKTLRDSWLDSAKPSTPSTPPAESPKPCTAGLTEQALVGLADFPQAIPVRDPLTEKKPRRDA